MKFIHTADLHIGTSFLSSSFDKSIARERREDLFKAFNKVIKACKKREADIMADKKKSSRTKVIWKIKTILRNPRFISFFDGVRGTKIDKVYTFIAYDLLDYGLLYFVQRLLRKIRK